MGDTLKGGSTHRRSLERSGTGMHQRVDGRASGRDLDLVDPTGSGPLMEGATGYGLGRVLWVGEFDRSEQGRDHRCDIVRSRFVRSSRKSAKDVVRVGSDAKEEGKIIGLIEVVVVTLSFALVSDEEEQRTGRHWVQSSGVG